jgi:glycosyltransferase involved in cell wall biosynthesis
VKALYLSYDGMTDPLGGSQVLPYLEGLAKRGHRIWLVSCEKPDADRQAWDRAAKQCEGAGIEWRPLRYHRRPPVLSTLWDVRALDQVAESLQKNVAFDLVHCRGYVTALVGLRLKRRHDVPFLFDMRGFWPDEKVESGSWSLANPLFKAIHRFFKKRETDFLLEADAIVSLTRAAREEMMSRPADKRPRREAAVIPCCVDLDHFGMRSNEMRRAARQELGIDHHAPVLGYLGSLGEYYMLDDMLRFFVALRAHRPGARFLFVTKNPPAPIRQAAASHGIGPDELIIRAADRADVPRLISAADYGVCFIWPTFAKTACSPTKLGEMLALGIPVAVNAGVGDVDAVMADTKAGVTVDRFDTEALMVAADALISLATGPAQIREGAKRWFRLDDGIMAYDELYRSLGPAAGAPLHRAQ